MRASGLETRGAELSNSRVGPVNIVIYRPCAGCGVRATKIHILYSGELEIIDSAFVRRPPRGRRACVYMVACVRARAQRQRLNL